MGCTSARKVHCFHEGASGFDRTLALTGKTLCGLARPFPPFRTEDPHKVTCRKCQAVLAREGALERESCER